MTKKYRALNSLHLTTTAIVNGVEAVVEFKGGRVYPKRVNGMFITSNKLLQDALESSSGFGKSFVLDGDVGCDSVEEQQTQELPLDSVETGVEPTFNENSAGDFIPLEWVVNKQMAMEWLEGEMGICVAKRSTLEKIESEANRCGYSFVNLKIDK